MKRFSLLWLLLFLPLLVAFRPAQQSSDVTMRVQAGLAGWYRAGQWIPLQVSVQSQNTTLEGQLQVRVKTASSSTVQFETTYRTPFTISAGGSKRVFLYVSLDDFSQEVQVELVDRSGHVAVSQRESIRQLAYDDVLYGVVTDSPLGAPDVSRFALGRGNSYQFRWTIEDIPPNPEALRSLDVLIFTDVDTGQLTSDQQQAIADWTAGGGHLIVTGGPNWQQTTIGLSALLPTQPEATVTLEDIRPLGEFVRDPAEELATPTLVADNNPLENAQVLLAVDNVPLLVRRGLGAGTVDFVAVDSTVEPLRSWSGFPALWYELVISAQPRPSWSHGIERFELGRDAVSNVTGFDLPSILQLGAFLLAYILLMGPLNYVLLSIIHRRELAWLTIPSLILVFSVFAYLTGFSIRGNDVTVNQVSVVQVWHDSSRARVDSVIGILSPRRTTYDVLMRDPLSLRTLPNVSGPASISQIVIVEGSTYVAEDIPVDAAIMTSFTASGYLAAPPISGSATWLLRGGGVSSRINGEVTNGMDIDLQDVVILADDQVFGLGNLAAGATQSFQLNVPLERPLRQPLGSRVDPMRPVLFSGSAYYASFDSSLCYMVGGLNQVYRSVMQGKKFTCGGGSDDEELKLRRRALILAATNNEIDLNGGRGSSVYLLGWGETPVLNIEIPNTGQVDDGTVLYIYEIPTTIRATNLSRIILPPGMTTWTLVEQDQPNRLPDVNADLSFQLTGNQGVAVRFTPLPAVPLKRVSDFVLTVDWRLGTQDIVVSLWNWEADEWQALEFTEMNQTEFIIKDLAFVGPQNAVQVLVESESAVSFQSIEKLTVTLRGTG